MTAPAVTGDVRGFYAALGIALPQWPAVNANVRCFANPEHHHHGDRRPSTSIRLADGIWKCHGCGTTGTPFDAAIARGHSRRQAMDLLRDHHLADPLPPLLTGREVLTRQTSTAPAPTALAEADRRWGATSVAGSASCAPGPTSPCASHSSADGPTP